MIDQKMNIQEWALGMLRETLEQHPGRLMVITNEILPILRENADDPRSPVRADLLAEDPTALQRHGTFVCHAVTEILGPDARGYVAAVTAEGDACMGRPYDVLARCSEVFNDEARQAAIESRG